ncbi:MAG: SPASM domain-containing protein [Elusimicrobia bacterium]|nr:SPASM domain-containing protein [Elusimicrobiota bacterium]
MSPSATAAVGVEANRALAWEEFQAGALSLRSRPFKASIEITRNCNYKCIMCAQSWNPLYARYNPAFNMKPATFRKIAHELFPSLEYAHLQGYGETVISPHWPEILEMCRPYEGKVRFGLVTNLSRRDPAMWRRMVEMGFAIIFSCDGATAETFEKIRVGGDFSHILENLEVIRRARAEFPGRGLLDFHMTLQRLNYREMPGMVDLAARFGADRVTFASVKGNGAVGYHLGRAASWVREGKLDWRAIASMGRAALRLVQLNPRQLLRPGTVGVSIYDVPKGRLLEAKRAAQERSRATGMPLVFEDSYLLELGEETGGRIPDLAAGIEGSVQVARHQKCFKPYSYVVINYKGDVGLCNHLIKDESWKQMGSLEESTFEEIWNSAAYREMREKLLNARPDNPSCRWCFAHRMAD